MSAALEIVHAVRSLLARSPVPADFAKVDEAARRATDDEAALWSVVRKMARAMGDPHTMLLTPAMASGMMAIASGRPAVSAGFAVHRAGTRFVVGEVTPGSAAEHAGLRPGALVLAIEGEPLARGMEDVGGLLGRAAGTEAALTIDEGGTRREVRLPLIEARLPLSEARRLGADVGYLRFRFVTLSADPEGDVATLVRRGVEQLGAGTLRGIVLDLRSNPGGYGVTRVASVLTAGDPIVVYRDANGHEEPAPRSGEGPAWGGPLVVLVDEQTLSAAEMITLALREHEHARVVGQPTAGGLTVPRYVPLEGGYVLMVPEKIALGPRTRKTPAGFRVHPDVLVSNRTPEDFVAGRDPQLEAALAALRAGRGPG